MVVASQDVLPAAVEYHTKRLELLHSPSYWLWECLRFLGYTVGSVVLVPWLLVWPAIVVWAAWMMAGGSLHGAAELLTTGSPEFLAWLYIAGAFGQSLTIIGSRPYESELSRRLTAWEITRNAQAERVRRGFPPRRGAT